MRKFLLLTLLALGSFSGAYFYSSLPFFPDSDHSAVGEEREETRSGALEALDFWNRSRAYPNNDIPASAYTKAYTAAKLKDRHLPHAMTAGAVWDPIGPSNLQGRTRCVAVNPQNRNTVYVGTASGGLWVSHTMGLGADWQQVELGLPALGISSILINPLDTNIMYLGTGEVYGYQSSLGGLVVRTTRGSYGIGILKSVDGGQTWTKSLDWSYQQQRGIEMLKFNPHNPNSVWAATSEGLYRSMDAGSTWDQLSSIILAKDVIVNPGDTNWVSAAFGNFASPGTGIYISNDYGASWSETNLTNFSGKARLAVYEGAPNVLYASVADSTTGAGALWRSLDYGNFWTQLATSAANPIFQVQGWYSHYVIVHPTDSSKIVHNSVLRSKSTNGGQTFSNISSGYSDNHGFALDPTNPNIVYGVGDDGVYRSVDFGSSWVNIGSGIQSGQFYNGFSCSSSDSLVAIGQSQDHIPGYRYTGTLSWNHTGVSDESGWTAIDPTNDNYMYCVDRYGTDFLRSTNRGSTWATTANFGGAGAWNSPIVVSPSIPTTLYMGEKRIWKTTNRGTTWTTTNGGIMLDGNAAISIAISATNPDTVLVGMAPLSAAMHIFRTVNGGTSWQNVSTGLPNRYPLDLALDPTNSRVGFATFGGFGTGHVFKTTDAGSTWTDFTGTLPDVPTSAVAFDPLHPANVYIGNDIGVYVSTDGGSTWANFSEGLPDAVIAADLVISPSNRALRIATHGNGVWERKLINELPGDYADFSAQSLISPKGGGKDTLSPAMGPVKASFRNLSVAGHNQVTLKYRIVKSNVEVYSSTTTVSDFPPGETRVITFPDQFNPTSTGTYRLEATVESADANHANDTVRANFNVLEKPDMYLFSVNKIHSVYTEISGGTAGPAGDDAQTRAGLPFVFTYDGFDYDSVQISTNGWMELGTGTRGSFHGLSTDDQLGTFFVQALGTSDRPTKTLAPWWTDMATNAGLISYTTEGTTPTRTFTVQWKNVLSYYDAGSTDIALNFQIKLHETSNLIEFCYGPRTGSYYLGAGTGAAMGLKDYIGGDFRFYDLKNRGTGMMGMVRTDLFPLTDWPGADSAFTITTDAKLNGIGITSGWNLVSVPALVSDARPSTLFGANLASNAFAYQSGYKNVDTLANGSGYWIKAINSDSVMVVGAALNTVSVHLNAGWNLIGSCDHEVAAPTGGIVTSLVFGYGGSGYSSTNTLKPGKGYWVKASSAGNITLGPIAVPKSVPQIFVPGSRGTTTLSVTDAAGGTRRLYFLAASSQSPSSNAFELPPPPPSGTFDVRFADQQFAETYSHADEIFPIQILNASPLVTLTFESQEASTNFIVEEEFANKSVKSTYVRGNQAVAVSSESRIRVRTGERGNTPIQFALAQNYPNPFNPTTTIAFELATKTSVTLVLYDLSGKEVRILASGEYEAGRYSISADLSGLASGMYVYKLSAGNFNDAKKLLLLR